MNAKVNAQKELSQADDGGRVKYNAIINHSGKGVSKLRVIYGL